MNCVQLLRDQMKWAHEVMEGTMADVTEEVAHFVKTGKALPVGAAYAHAVMSEDVIVATMLANKKPLCTTGVETGLSEPMPGMDQWEKHDQWARTVKVDLAKFKEYAAKVYVATDEYLVGLTDAGLEKEIDLTGMGMGKQNVAYVISNFLVLHAGNLAGEVSAAKGFQGLKGYPF